METMPTFRRQRQRAQSQQGRPGFLSLESPSVATAREYYHHNHTPREINNNPNSTPTPRTIVLRPLRRHSVVQNAPALNSNSGETDDVDPEGVSSEEKMLRARDRRGFLLQNSSSSSTFSISPFGQQIPALHSYAGDLPLHSPTYPHLPISAFLSSDGRIHNPLHPLSLGNIPFGFTCRKLLDWGRVYLYNTATADVFVRAVPLRVPKKEIDSNESRTSRAPREGEKLEESKDKDEELEKINTSLDRTKIEDSKDTIQVETVNANKDDLEDTIHVRQEPSTPEAKSTSGKGNDTTNSRNAYFSPPVVPAPWASTSSSLPHTRQYIKIRIRIIPSVSSSPSRITLPRQPLIIEKAFPVNPTIISVCSSSSTSTNPPSPLLPSSKTTAPAGNNHPQPQTLPIHVEYATYRAPLLGAILVSGFVKRGDTVEIPLPWPEVWDETVVRIYTCTAIGGEETKEGVGGGDSSSSSNRLGKMDKIKWNLEYLGWREQREMGLV